MNLAGDKMTSWAARRLDELESENLSGFVFKSGSPSCGLRDIEVCRADGEVNESGMGIFARMFRERFALVPHEDELKLRDPALFENFIERLRAFQRG